MGRPRFTPEQIIAKLREVDVVVGRGSTAVEACRQIGISEQTLYRWRKEYGGRLRPQHRGDVWSYDFVEDQTHIGRKYRMLNIIGEFSRECLAMAPLRRFRSNDVIDVLADLFIEHGPPEHKPSILVVSRRPRIIPRAQLTG
jgi:transposase-like protein